MVGANEKIEFKKRSRCYFGSKAFLAGGLFVQHHNEDLQLFFYRGTDDTARMWAITITLDNVGDFFDYCSSKERKKDRKPVAVKKPSPHKNDPCVETNGYLEMTEADLVFVATVTKKATLDLDYPGESTSYLYRFERQCLYKLIPYLGKFMLRING